MGADGETRALALRAPIGPDEEREVFAAAGDLGATDVGAVAARGSVNAGAAVEVVAPRSSPEPVPPGTPEQPVGAGAAGEYIPPALPDQDVVPAPTQQPIVPGAAAEDIVAAAAVHDVVSPPGVDDVRPGRSHQHVGSGGPGDRHRPSPAGENRRFGLRR
jgi:hypothetical protein